MARWMKVIIVFLVAAIGMDPKVIRMGFAQNTSTLVQETVLPCGFELSDQDLAEIYGHMKEDMEDAGGSIAAVGGGFFWRLLVSPPVRWLTTPSPTRDIILTGSISATIAGLTSREETFTGKLKDAGKGLALSVGTTAFQYGLNMIGRGIESRTYQLTLSKTFISLLNDP